MTGSAQGISIVCESGLSDDMYSGGGGQLNDMGEYWVIVMKLTGASILKSYSMSIFCVLAEHVDAAVTPIMQTVNGFPFKDYAWNEPAAIGLCS